MLQSDLRNSCVLACGRERTKRRFSASRSPYVLSSSSSVPCPSPAARRRCGERGRIAQNNAPAQICTAAAHALCSLPGVRVRACSACKKGGWRAAGTYMRTRQCRPFAEVASTAEGTPRRAFYLFIPSVAPRHAAATRAHTQGLSISSRF